MNIFKNDQRRLADRRLEFNAFRYIVAKEAKSRASALREFSELDGQFSFYVSPKPSNDTIQIWFGRRHTGRTDANGNPVVEQGACLLYSFGPTGDTLTALYPCTSSVYEMPEGAIYLRNGHRLFIDADSGLTSDLKDLFAYCIVSSLGAKATFPQGFRIGWLRFTSARQLAGVYAKPAWAFWLASSAGAVAKGGLSAMGKLAVSLSVAGVLVVMALFGLSHCSVYRILSTQVHSPAEQQAASASGDQPSSR